MLPCICSVTCDKNISDKLGYCYSADVVCDLLLNKRITKWNPFEDLIYFYLLFLHCDRKRDNAKLCTKIAWRNNCNHSDVADGILKRVIGSFNPFCKGDKDLQTEETDQCANYPTPPDADVCLRPSEKPKINQGFVLIIQL